MKDESRYKSKTSKILLNLIPFLTNEQTNKQSLYVVSFSYSD